MAQARVQEEDADAVSNATEVEADFPEGDLAPRAVDDIASSSSSSSSTSSSSSSSGSSSSTVESDTASDSDADSAAAGAHEDKDERSSTAREDAEEEPDDRLGRRRLPKLTRPSFYWPSPTWGPCLMTWVRRANSDVRGWQATCPCHLDEATGRSCTRSRSFKGTDDAGSAESLRVLNLLKHWLVAADGHDSKHGHQHVSDERVLQEGLDEVRLREAMEAIPTASLLERHRPQDSSSTAFTSRGFCAFMVCQVWCISPRNTRQEGRKGVSHRA